MSTYLRKSPDSGSEKAAILKKGDRLILEKEKEQDGWLFVSTATGKIKGWIRKDTIGSPSKKTVPTVENTKVISSRDRVVSNKVSQPVVDTISSAPVNRPKTNTVDTASVKTIASTPETEPAEEAEEVISVDTEEVNLNVRVVDSNNRTVKTLNAEDFKVYEDGILQPIASLNTTEIPMINALVIDNSRSLRSQLRDIIEAGKIIVVKNRSMDESAVIRFVGAEKIDIVQDFTVNKSSIIEGLENLYVEGGQTAIIDAVYLAAKKIDQYRKSTQKDDLKLRALILVSDGDDRSSKRGEEELFQLLRASQVQIYAIGFINELSEKTDTDGINHQKKAKDFLKRLTEETGGKVYFPDSLGELPQIAADISTELHTQYLVSYTPTAEQIGGTFHRLKVVVADGKNKEKRIAITRAGRVSEPKQ